MMEEIWAMTSRSSELCFNKEDFTAKDFSVDHFVSEYRKQIPLETLKDDLGLFLKVLQSAMVELINKDYADFVNLSTNLVGLDKSINNLRKPIHEVEKELMDFCTILDGTLCRLENLIKEKDEAHSKKAQTYGIICILEGIRNIEKQNLKHLTDNHDDILSCELLERIAVELKKIKFHTGLVSDVQIVNEKQIFIQEFSDNLLQHLDYTFLKSLSNHNEENLFKVLRIYSLIDKTEEVENKFRLKVVRPYMREVIHENIIANEGINQMYNRIIDFIPKKCSSILSITSDSKKDIEMLKGYDFLVNSVWPEIVICLEYIASTIFALGNPALFHKNFTASMEFLEKFENLCISKVSVERLREHSSYHSFIKKWDIHIYFEIRFQEIGANFENALLSPFQKPDEGSFHLNATCILWKCITLCWNEDVYISSLCSEFWKLTLQLLSRYYVWVTSIIKEADADDYLEDPVFHNLALNYNEAHISIVFLVLLVEDVELIIRKILQYFQLVISSKLLIKSDIFYNSLKEQIEFYNYLPEGIGKIIIKRLTSQCSQHLKLITDIPRLYRKTNREVPSKSSSYVSMIFAPLDLFLSRTDLSVSADWKSEWTNAVIDQVIQQCYHMITEVITSVKKMEDSLKRLKKARDKPVGGQIASGAMSDDDKIRHQLVIDVQAIGNSMKKFKINEYNVNYNKLEELVRSTIKTSNEK